MSKVLICAVQWILLLSIIPGIGVGQERGTQSETGERLAITNVSVLPMDSERVLTGQTVLIENGRIVRIDSTSKLRLSDEVKIIDGTGRFLIPGLADMHVHLRYTEEALSYLIYGVTTIMHFGGSEQRGADNLELRKSVENGSVFGPQIFTTNTIFRGGQEPEEVRERVRRLKAEGYDFAKIYNGVTLTEFDAIKDEGAKQSIPIFGHIPRGFDPIYSLSHGQRMVAHTEELFFTYFKGPRATNNMDRNYRPDLSLVPELISLLKKNEVAVTPALGFTYLNFRQWDGNDNIWDSSEFRYLHPNTLSDWQRSNVLARRSDLENFIFRGQIKYGLLQELTREFQKAGILQLLGTDASVVGIYPGRSAHTELTEFVKAGLSNFEALSIATRNAGEFVRREIDRDSRFGMVKEGYRADLLLLEGNPFQNIHNVRKIVIVIANGKWKTRQEIGKQREQVASEYAQMKRFSNSLSDAFTHKDFAARIRSLYSLNKEDPRMMSQMQSGLNSLGYSFLSMKEFESAIGAFTMNTELFPKSANTWDSLAEGYLTIGNKEKAIEFYEKALETDQNLDSAKQALQKIRKDN